MPVYGVEFTPGAARAFKKIKDRAIQRRLGDALIRLGTNPRPKGIEKLAGAESVYRIRVGDYRIIYEIHDSKLVVLVVRIAHRNIVYTR